LIKKEKISRRLNVTQLSKRFVLIGLYWIISRGIVLSQFRSKNIIQSAQSRLGWTCFASTLGLHHISNLRGSIPVH